MISAYSGAMVSALNNEVKWMIAPACAHVVRDLAVVALNLQDRGRGIPFVLEGGAVEIWAMIATSQEGITAMEMAQTLADRYGEPEDSMLEAVQTLIAQLRTLDLLVSQ